MVMNSRRSFGSKRENGQNEIGLDVEKSNVVDGYDDMEFLTSESDLPEYEYQDEISKQQEAETKKSEMKTQNKKIPQKEYKNLSFALDDYCNREDNDVVILSKAQEDELEKNPPQKSEQGPKKSGFVHNLKMKAITAVVNKLAEQTQNNDDTKEKSPAYLLKYMKKKDYIIYPDQLYKAKGMSISESAHRLDTVVSRIEDFSRKLGREMLKYGHVRVNADIETNGGRLVNLFSDYIHICNRLVEIKTEPIWAAIYVPKDATDMKTGDAIPEKYLSHLDFPFNTTLYCVDGFDDEESQRTEGLHLVSSDAEMLNVSKSFQSAKSKVKSFFGLGKSSDVSKDDLEHNFRNRNHRYMFDHEKLSNLEEQQLIVETVEELEREDKLQEYDISNGLQKDQMLQLMHSGALENDPLCKLMKHISMKTSSQSKIKKVRVSLSGIDFDCFPNTGPWDW
eukprot:CAMPEP_0182448706 /NCGR_PEP_ID=MMETSP1172-20130603/29010_1 /TAXON_ID=708627 /ORGANISM="Timspurckia oligopyrenoides, Strain CCMP3278" /LENGTH=449 /DNA_ID=CAMNT_0024645667 /DNA_START=166 /DNA_END=1512 /DNA_ORIENTATION=-